MVNHPNRSKKRRYYITHEDDHGERHQLDGEFIGKTPKDALYSMLEQSGGEDDGRWEVWQADKPCAVCGRISPIGDCCTKLGQ